MRHTTDISAARREKRSREAQSLIELLVAVAIGALLLITAVAALVPALRTTGRTGIAYTGTLLARELLDNVRVWAEGDWSRLLALAPGSLSHYFLNASNSPFFAVSGDETVAASSTVYTRYFFVDNAFRDANGFLATDLAGNRSDPSTKKVTVVWGAEGTPTTTLSLYLTRYRNDSTVYTDWSGGPDQSGPVTNASIDNRFWSSSNIEYANPQGSISLTANPGTLDSSTFDTGSASGAQLNAVVWRGDQPAGASVEFQFATSSVPSPPSWDFIGPDGTSSAWYDVLVSTPAPLDFRWHAGRYFRYRIRLTASGSSPRVDEVAINWSP